MANLMGDRVEGSPRESPGNDFSIFNPLAIASEDLLLPSEAQWKTMLESSCTFEPENFSTVMLNLIKNPNIMSSHLFRADIFYDSQNDAFTLLDGESSREGSFIKHMKTEYQPAHADVPDYDWQRTFVRQLVPRNRQLDKDLIQTCHFYTKRTPEKVFNLVLYIPHVASADEIPWYHPTVRQLAFLHAWPTDTTVCSQPHGTISLHFSLFCSEPLTTRLERTALQLLRTIHKHGQGQKRGYVKRVHHDQIIPQQRFQDTYARLKAKYAKALIGDWVEQTDPGKHVFEDLGIAAFLIELWADMYGTLNEVEGEAKGEKKPFPSFVDIGCGNGVLINILVQEGYEGWGFDARRRKTWETFPTSVQDRVKEMILVPSVFGSPANNSHGGSNSHSNAGADEDPDQPDGRHFHSGVFPQGTFIISNHADELTAWTPLLAYLNDSRFIAIPCCSHDLAGSRFRAPPHTKACRSRLPSSPNGSLESEDISKSSSGNVAADEHPDRSSLQKSQAAETGSLARTAGKGKQQQSAYATLCAYVASLAEEVGIEAEKEMLRIPSTRNACILGRWQRLAGDPHLARDGGQTNNPCQKKSETEKDLGPLNVVGQAQDSNMREEVVKTLVERELGLPIADVGMNWISRAKLIAGKKGDSH